MSKRKNKPDRSNRQPAPPPSPIDDFVASSSPPSGDEQHEAAGSTASPPLDEQLEAGGSTASPPPCRTSGAEEKPIVDGVLTCCPRCGSTERTDYSNKREMPYEGQLPNGQQFNFVVWRDTRCAVCLQRRCDRHHELRPSNRTPHRDTAQSERTG